MSRQLEFLENDDENGFQALVDAIMDSATLAKAAACSAGKAEESERRARVFATNAEASATNANESRTSVEESERQARAYATNAAASSHRHKNLMT